MTTCRHPRPTKKKIRQNQKLISMRPDDFVVAAGRKLVLVRIHPPWKTPPMLWRHRRHRARTGSAAWQVSRHPPVAAVQHRPRWRISPKSSLPPSKPANQCLLPSDSDGIEYLTTVLLPYYYSSGVLSEQQWSSSLGSTSRALLKSCGWDTVGKFQHLKLCKSEIFNFN